MAKKSKSMGNATVYAIVFIITFTASIFVSYFLVSSNPNILSTLAKLLPRGNVAPKTSSLASSGDAEMVKADNIDGTLVNQALLGLPIPESELVSTTFFKDTLFVGDSLTLGLKNYGVMSFNNVVAYDGIDIDGVMNRPVFETEEGYATVLEAMRDYNPKQIYIMLGTNSIQYTAVDLMISQYTQLIEMVQKQHPGSVIFMQSILPVGYSYELNNPLHSNEKIDQVNEQLLELCADYEVYYLDVASAFKDENGYLNSIYSPNDGLHLSATGYDAWVEYLRTHTVS